MNPIVIASLFRRASARSIVGWTVVAACVVLPGSAWAFCGDGVIDGIEACDDGNVNDDDGCNNDCTLSAGCVLYPAPGLPVPIPVIGATFSNVTVTQTGNVREVEVVGLAGTHTWVSDLQVTLTGPSMLGVVLMDFVCDDMDDFFLSFDDDATGGVTCPPTDGMHHLPTIDVFTNPILSALDGQPAAGTWTLGINDLAAPDGGVLNAWSLLVCTAECGNGVPEAGEECDDGNLVDDDACDSNCTVTACGNGIQTTGELCDDGNTDPGDGCRANCTVEACGDGIEDPQERCDDGNVAPNDGCDPDCTLPCPADFCDCLDSAALFDVVGTLVDIAPDKLSYSGYSYPIGAETTGGVCALTGKFAGKADAETAIGTDLVATSGVGTTALKVKGYKLYGDPMPGLAVGRDLVTGGGIVKDLAATVVAGATSLTGTHPLVATCTDALTDAQAASNLFKALPANQTLDKIVVPGGEDVRIDAGPGIYVIAATSIQVKSFKDYDEFEGGTLTIGVAPETDAVIINVEKGISLSQGAGIVVDGAPERVILNVHNGFGKVKVSAESVVDPAILAPGGKMQVKRFAESGNLIGGAKTQVKGAVLEDVLGCGD
jgi:cysteine-rich repeat protein